MSDTITLYTFVIIFSLCVGSLLNVFIYRVPLMLAREWRCECQSLLNIEETGPKTPSINLFFPRSYCPRCQIKLRILDNIPLLSYLFLKGRCYNCKLSIPIRYPIVELMTAVLSTYSFYLYGPSLYFVFACLFLWTVIPIFFIDLDEQIIPDSFAYSLLWIGLLANTQALYVNLDVAVYSTVGAWLSLWGFIQLFYLCTGKIGMGNGDFKLFAAFGAWFGWTALPFIILLSSFTGAIIGSIYLKITKQAHATPIPFGPFLCISAMIYLFWGEQIIDFYLRSML